MHESILAQKRLEAKRRAKAARRMKGNGFNNLARNKKESRPLTGADRKRQSPRMKTIIVQTSEGK